MKEIWVELPENMDQKLEDLVLNLPKFAPQWGLNRQRDPETGENTHLIMADLDFTYTRLIKIQLHINGFP